MVEDGDRLFAQPAFYAELAPLARDSHVVESRLISAASSGATPASRPARSSGHGAGAMPGLSDFFKTPSRRPA